ncbi:MAG: calcium-binding protein, partial [Planctomyces sp.]
IDRITSPDTTGGHDNIAVGAGNNIVVSGNGNDLVSTGTGNDIVLGDTADLTFGLTGRLRTLTGLSNLGGSDMITISGGDNIVLGGAGEDQITTGNGYDIVLGDVGTINTIIDDADESDIDRIVAPGSAFGDDDIIATGGGAGFIFGGTGSDSITAGSGTDLIFGDHGQLQGDISPAALPLNMNTDPFTFTSIDTDATYFRNHDFIRAGASDDIVLGGQGDDRILGESGDDDLIGGHNVVDGADGNDQIDAGSGHDVVTGDNAVILRETRVTDTRWRALSGTELLSVTGNGVLTGAAQADPTARQKRSITLLNHTSLTSALV